MHIQSSHELCLGMAPLTDIYHSDFVYLDGTGFVFTQKFAFPTLHLVVGVVGSPLAAG